MATAVETPARTVVRRFPAGSPRGSWPAEEFAAQLRAGGRSAAVIMSMDDDAFLVVTPTGEAAS